MKSGKKTKAGNKGSAKKVIKKILKIITVLGLALLVVPTAILTGVIITITMFNQVEMDKFINEEIAFGGYNGYGQIQQEFVDYDALAQKMYGKKYDEHYDDEKFKKCISCEFKDGIEEGLSNGDVIAVTICVDYDKINDLDGTGRKLVGEEEYVVEYTVKDLKEAKKINVFDVIENVHNEGTAENPDVVFSVKEKVETDYYTLTTHSYYSKIKVNIELKLDDGTTKTDSIYIYLDKLIYNKESGDVTVEISDETTKFLDYGFVFGPVSVDYDTFSQDETSEYTVNTNVFSAIKKIKNVGTKYNPEFVVECESDEDCEDGYWLTAKYENNVVYITVSYIYDNMCSYDVPVTISVGANNYDAETGKITLSIDDDVSEYNEMGYNFIPMAAVFDVE